MKKFVQVGCGIRGIEGYAEPILKDYKEIATNIEKLNVIFHGKQIDSDRIQQLIDILPSIQLEQQKFFPNFSLDSELNVYIIDQDDSTNLPFFKEFIFFSMLSKALSTLFSIISKATDLASTNAVMFIMCLVIILFLYRVNSISFSCVEMSSISVYFSTSLYSMSVFILFILSLMDLISSMVVFISSSSKLINTITPK